MTMADGGTKLTRFGYSDSDGKVSWTFPAETTQQTEMSRWLLLDGLPDFLDNFLSKNADYGDQHLHGLGPRGEFVGIHRKVAKLQKAVWEGEEMNHEGAEEMLRDLIGTAFLMLHLLDRE